MLKNLSKQRGLTLRSAFVQGAHHLGATEAFELALHVVVEPLARLVGQLPGNSKGDMRQF